VVDHNQYYDNCILLDDKVLSALSSSILNIMYDTHTVRKRTQLGITRTDLLRSCPPRAPP
jgi:hypothetical protein